MKQKKCQKLYLSLILLMMILAGCSTHGQYNPEEGTCYELPKGGKPVGDVYRKLEREDKQVMNEYFNRIYKFSQLSIICK